MYVCMYSMWMNRVGSQLSRPREDRCDVKLSGIYGVEGLSQS